jgi:large subunit ribosomal protein L19
MKQIDALNEKQLKKVPELKSGDTVRVHTKIIEGNKERIQVFEGVVIKVKGSGINQTFTVRKISYGVGVERTFLIHSPRVSKVEVVKRARVRKAYLTYLRGLRGKAAKLRDKQFDSLTVNVKEEELKPEDLAPPAAEEPSDEEITELSTDEDAKEAEVKTGDLEKAENKEAGEDAGDTEADLGAEHQLIETEEIAEGIEEAQNDEEHENEMDYGKRDAEKREEV